MEKFVGAKKWLQRSVIIAVVLFSIPTVYAQVDTADEPASTEAIRDSAAVDTAALVIEKRKPQKTKKEKPPKVFSSTNTQNDPAAAKKQWKKIARQYVKDPLALQKRERERQYLIDSLTVVAQKLYEKLQEISKGYVNLEGDVRNAIKNGLLELEVRDTHIDSLNNRIRTLENAYVALQEAYEANQKRTTTNDPNAKGKEKNEEVIFRVQIGAYNIAKHTLQLLESDVTRETGPNNVNRYVLGRFTDYNRAAAYRDEVRRLGIKDAFVTAYHNGKRITVPEALEIQKKRPASSSAMPQNNKPAPTTTNTKSNVPANAPIKTPTPGTPPVTEPITKPKPPYDSNRNKAEKDALRNSDADEIRDKERLNRPIDE